MKPIPTNDPADQLRNQLTRQAATSDTPPTAEYTIDELAQAGMSTVRNVRAYQDRGLLPAPERRGRAGVYTDVHLSRLKLISQLLERNYSLSNIKEMLSAWEQGQKLGDLMGLESAITSPWSKELPGFLKVEEVLQLFNTEMIGELLDQAIALGILVPEAQRFRVPSPRLLNAGAELVRAGIPLSALLDLLAGLRKNCEQVAMELTARAAQLFDAFPNGKPDPEQIPRLADLAWRLRPLALVAVEAEVERALEKAASNLLADRVGQLLKNWPPNGKSD